MSTIQKEKDSLRNELTAFQKEAQSNISTLKKEDDLLKTDLTTETKKLQADLRLRLENLQSEIRILSTGVEDYKEFLQRTSKEIDRVREDIALRTRMLQEREKPSKKKTEPRRIRIRASEERIKGMEDRLKGLDEKIVQVASKQVELEKSAQVKEIPPTRSEGVFQRLREIYIGMLMKPFRREI